MSVYNILEVANTHGGSKEYLLALIDQFKEFDTDHGMKFQPLKADEIATKSFSAYPIYEKLHFTETEWREILQKAAATKDIWIDVFDLYGIRIIEQNMDLVTGIKLQASVLQNQVVLEGLAKLNLTNKLLIINISAYSLEEIQAFIQTFTDRLNPKELLLEVGFQAYPTELQDSGISKLQTLKSHFSNRIVFADHIAGTHEDARWLPVMATLLGADFIEKHIMHDSLPTEYDHFSSMTVENYRLYLEAQKRYAGLTKKSFINQREIEYLEKTIQIPLAGKKLAAGTLVNEKQDLVFKRSGETGLNAKQIKNLQQNLHVLAVEKAPETTFQAEDFKKATIGTIIACRLKSTRLTSKALLKIGELTSVEYCIKNCLKLEQVNYTILATSTVEQDAPLENYTYRPDVKFFRGHPDDVIQRYLGVAEKYNLDVIIRVTADMPFVSNEILQILLQSHFETGADYTVGKDAAVGTNLEIINVSALKYVKQFFPNADYSEYMTWYFQNNAEHFKLNFVELPAELVRDYRLTLDFQEDLDMFNAVERHFQETKQPFSLKALFSFLDQHAEIASLNQDIQQKYKSDPELIATLNAVTKIPDFATN